MIFLMLVIAIPSCFVEYKLTNTDTPPGLYRIGAVYRDYDRVGSEPSYDRTLMAWHARFEAAWPELQKRYDDRFHRLWRYYLLCCAGAFRARANQLWQVVLSPEGVPGGWRFRNGAVGLNSAA